MTTLMYAITGPGRLEGTGIDGHPLEAVGDRDLVAVVSHHDRCAPAPTEHTLWQYERVIEGLMGHGPVLPARFGSAFDDTAAVQALVTERRDQLTAGLERVRGAVELSVRLAWREPAQVPTDSGSAYLLGRLRLHRRALEIADRLDDLAAAARASRYRLLPDAGTPVLAAYLVDRSCLSEFKSLVGRLDQQLGDVDVVCTGPWPPYSFAEGDQA